MGLRKFGVVGVTRAHSERCNNWRRQSGLLARTEACRTESNAVPTARRCNPASERLESRPYAVLARTDQIQEWWRRRRRLGNQRISADVFTKLGVGPLL